MSIVGTEHIKLPHADAWGKSASPSSSRGPRTGINQNKNTDKARIVDLWSSASSELEAKQKREQERKYDVSILFCWSFFSYEIVIISYRDCARHALMGKILPQLIILHFFL